MKFLSFVAMASMALAAPSMEKRAPTPLKVELELLGNSEVKATVTNTGKKNLKVLKAGTLLDDAPVEKAQVYTGDHNVEFDGVRLTIATENLGEDAFQRIGAGETIEVTFDVAELHDLSLGGKFDIATSGTLQFAEDGSTELVGSVPFESNHLEAEVDGDLASESRVNFHAKRTRIQSDCTGSQLSASTASLRGCVDLATLGQQAAQSGPAAKMVEFFKSSSTATRNTVAQVFSRMRTECGSTTGGASRWFCTDVYNSCSPGVIAYTLPSESYMAYCPIFFNQMPADSNSCRGQSRSNTALHEVAHLREIAGTDDFGGYGYEFIKSLTAAQNLRHADTYTLFAQSLRVGC